MKRDIARKYWIYYFIYFVVVVVAMCLEFFRKQNIFFQYLFIYFIICSGERGGGGILLSINHFWSYCSKRNLGRIFEGTFEETLEGVLNYCFRIEKNPENLTQSPHPDRDNIKPVNIRLISSFCGQHVKNWAEEAPQYS